MIIGLQKVNHSLLALLLSLSCLACSADDPTILEPDPSVLNLLPGTNDIEIEHGGLTRQMYVYVPPGFHPDSTYSLVLFLHGLGGVSEMGREILAGVLPDERFIGVSPQGHDASWNTQAGVVPSQADDIGFCEHIIDLISEEVTIDPNRIFSMGYSNGGGFSYHLAIHSERFAAVASLSASFTEGISVPPEIPRVSVIQMHGEEDQAVPYAGGESNMLDVSFQSAMETVLQWVRHDGLGETPREGTLEAGIGTYVFSEPGNPHEVRLYRFEDVDHNIGVLDYVTSLRCYEDILDFFESHPKPS